MNKQKQREEAKLALLNGSVDDELSVTQQQELNTLLKTSDRARQLHQELKALNGLLGEVPAREPPQYLHKAIVSQVRLPTAEQSRFYTWLSTNWLRTGLALAAGVVLTVGVYEMGSGPISPEDAASMAGTVVENPAAGQGELLDQIHISTALLDGSVELRGQNGLLILNMRLNSDVPTRVAVDFAGRGLEFEGISRMQDHEDAVSVINGSINVASSGDQRYTLKLRRVANTRESVLKPLELDFFANDTLVHAAELNVSK